MVVFVQKTVHDPQRSQQMVVVPQGKTVCLLNNQEDNKCWFSPRKQYVRLQTKSLAPQKSAGPCDNLSKMQGKMLKFLYYHQMVSHLQVLMRSLMRKQTLEVSLLPSNGILPPSAGKKFDEETNL